MIAGKWQNHLRWFNFLQFKLFSSSHSSPIPLTSNFYFSSLLHFFDFPSSSFLFLHPLHHHFIIAKSPPHCTMAMDRQSIMIIIIMIIFFSFPSGYEQPHSDKDKEVILYFQHFMTYSRQVLANSSYISGYGNLTGFRLSYEDNLKGHNALEWPLHQYSEKHPWVEQEKYSLLPNSISDDLKSWWGKDPVDTSDPAAPAYLLNVTGSCYGDYSMLTKTRPKLYFFEL